MKKLLSLIYIFLAVNVAFAQTIGGGREHSLAICSDNTVRAWGNNQFGRLGNGTSGSNTDSNVPIQVSFLTDVTSIAAGAYYSLALKNDSTVWAWGYNGFGQLGNGTSGLYTFSNVPVPVSAITGITAIATGSSHSLALKNDGSVWAWGWNGYGVLGNGTTLDSNVPINISSLTIVTSIAAAQDHSLALINDSTVWSWGNNQSGALGNGTFTNSIVPIPVSSISGITAIAGGWGHSIALKNNGTVWTWGDNGYGELGSGSNSNSNVPVQVNSLTGITAIAGGWWHSLALKNDGTVWAWGFNQSGQLGNGTFINSNIPVQVSSLTGIIAIASGGENQSFALKNDSTVWAWGNNSNGQLGNGTNISSNVPVQVIELCKVASNSYPPLAPASVNASICSLNTASLSAIGTGTLGWYSQATGGIYLGGGPNFTTPTLTTDTTFYVQDSTCAASATRTPVIVTIDYLKPPSPAASNVTICSGNTGLLSAAGTGTLGWYTAAIDGSYLGGGANYNTPPLTTNTTYYVQDSTCSASSMRTAVFVTVDNLKPPAPAGTNTTICSGSTASLSESGIGTLGWYSSATDGTYLGEGTNFITPVLTATTTYFVQDSTCAASSLRTPIQVVVTPLPDVGTNLNGITISANQNGAVYQWLDCNIGHSLIEGATNQSYNATINGNYAAIISMNGCSDTSACVNFNITGINEIVNNNNQLIIFPNPGNGTLTVTLSGVEGQSTSDGVYTIMNESGQTIQVFELNSGNKFTINIENLSNGIYFIVGYNNDNQMVRQKVVVAK